MTARSPPVAQRHPRAGAHRRAAPPLGGAGSARWSRPCWLWHLLTEQRRRAVAALRPAPGAGRGRPTPSAPARDRRLLPGPRPEPDPHPDRLRARRGRSASALGIAAGPLPLGRATCSSRCSRWSARSRRSRWCRSRSCCSPRNEQGIVFITFTAAFFPVLVSTRHAVRALPTVWEDALRTMGGSRRRVLAHGRAAGHRCPASSAACRSAWASPGSA